MSDRTKENLIPIIESSIQKGTQIISDEWRSSSKIDQIPEKEFSHLTVNHSHNFKDPKTGACTNKVESMWNVARSRNRKRWGTYCSMLD